MTYQIHTYTDAVKTAWAVADLIAQLANKAAKDNRFFHLAVSGGSTPKLLFQILADNFEKDIPWEKVKLYWVDERCVPPTHAESNYRMTFDALLYKGFLPEENIMRMKGENKPEDEALRYEQVLVAQLPQADAYPQFDLILLGMGDDGHTASIFPHQMQLLDTEQSVAVGTHPQSGQKRITLTGKTIHKAQQVAFLITGDTKASILKEIVLQEQTAEKYPAAHISSADGQVHFYLDKAAASLL